MPFPTTHTHTQTPRYPKKKTRMGKNVAGWWHRALRLYLVALFLIIMARVRLRLCWTEREKERETGKAAKNLFLSQAKPNVQLYDIYIYKYIYSMYFNAASFIEMATLIHISFHYSLLLLPQYILFCSFFPMINGKNWKNERDH